MARSQPSSKLSILGICLLVAFLAASADAASLRGTKEAAVVDENAEDSEDFYQAIVDEPFEDAPEDEQLDEERKLHRTNFSHRHGPNGPNLNRRRPFDGGYNVNVRQEIWSGGGGGGSQDATRNSYFISSNRAPYSNWDPWYNNGPVSANYVGVGANVYERAFYGGPRQRPNAYQPSIFRPPAVNNVNGVYSYGSFGNPLVAVNSNGNFVQGRSVNYLASF